jgi:hypothetical protein
MRRVDPSAVVAGADGLIERAGGDSARRFPACVVAVLGSIEAAFMR